MPYLSEKILIAHTSKDRRIKLSATEKEEIKKITGLSLMDIAKKYGVSKRLIHFIKCPEKLEENKKRRLERGGSKLYYNRKKNTEYMKKHRRYKQDLFKKGEIK